MTSRSLKAKGKDMDQPAAWSPTAANVDPPRAELKWEDEVLHITARGKWDRILKGASTVPVADMVLSQAACLGSHKKRADEKSTNFVLGFVDAMQPRDAAEVLLLTQMAAIHQATLMLARRLNHVENIPQQDAAERALNKLSRSYAVQMDTLKRYRSKGQQVVRVERVTVENGAQAVVGNVNHGGRGEDET
ncbi:hypothetical protein [Tabrizicola sp.]|uniref:hypothetical protein n=1 Tax=Tabrizicola sp. TaxID=2005166 RepID=UPI001A3FD050|nr:hypothetical protein [Tabrizicola sp.]MBL9075753.1 hypothetical protein [Tabrizicola sp.]